MSPYRQHRPLAVAGVAAATAYLSLGLVLLGAPWHPGTGGPAPSILPWIFLESLALAIWVPWRAVEESENRPIPNVMVRVPVGITGFLFLHAALAAVAGVPILRAILVQFALAAFALVAFALARAFRRAGLTRGSAQVLASGLLLAMATGPLWANPVVEHGSSNAWRGAAIQGLLLANPMAAGASVLEFDWLRSRVLYEVSVIGRYYPFEYPSLAGFLAAQGILCLALCGFARLRRSVARQRLPRSHF